MTWVLILIAAGLALGACERSDGTALDARVVSVPLPPNTRLAVQVCEQAIQDCDRWLYPDASGRFKVDKLDPSDYAVTVFLETPNGLVLLTSSMASVVAGQTTRVELVVPAIPSQPAT